MSGPATLHGDSWQGHAGHPPTGLGPTRRLAALGRAGAADAPAPIASKGDLHHGVRESQHYWAFRELERFRLGTFGGLGGAQHR